MNDLFVSEPQGKRTKSSPICLYSRALINEKEKVHEKDKQQRQQS